MSKGNHRLCEPDLQMIIIPVTIWGLGHVDDVLQYMLQCYGGSARTEDARLDQYR